MSKKIKFDCNECHNVGELSRDTYNKKVKNSEPLNCRACSYKIRSRKKIKDKIKLVCKACKKIREVVPHIAKRWHKREYLCLSCSGRKTGKTCMTTEQRREIMIAWHKNNPEKSSEIGKKRRKRVKITGAEMRRRQQVTIESDPEYYKKYCEKRSKIAKDFHDSLSAKEKEEHYKKVFKNTGKSKAEDEFFLYLKERENIIFERNQFVSGFIVDGIDYSKKIIVEFYGDIFHCNPEKFNNPEQYCSWLSRTVQEQWDRDKRRLASTLQIWIFCYNSMANTLG